MKPSDIKQLQYGDKVFWEDPEELLSRIVEVKKATVDSYNSVTIEIIGGGTIKCSASQLSKV